MSNRQSVDAAVGDPPNDADQPIDELFLNRWSPYRFEPRPIENEKILRCLEAARWAASSFNDQPWSWIIARRQDEPAFATLLDCLLEANQGWARNAGVLLLSVIRTSFRFNGKPNRVALHDLGAAAAQLTLQATALGIQAHQMAGVNLSKSRAVYEIPDGFEPQTAIALGYPARGEPDNDEERELQDRQRKPRQRLPLSDQVFAGKFGATASIVAAD